MRTVSLIALVLAATLAISCGSSEPPPSEPAAAAVEQPKESEAARGDLSEASAVWQRVWLYEGDPHYRERRSQ